MASDDDRTEVRAEHDEATAAQRATWRRGDFHRISRHNVIMAERLCDGVELRAGERVLDLACGSGTVALVAARRDAEVAGIDLVEELLDRGRQRGQAEGVTVDWHVGDVQRLPFDDDAFDVVLSTYGVQFAPDASRAAAELLRVARPGARLGLAGPVPHGWSGDWFATHVAHATPPPDGSPPDGSPPARPSPRSSVSCAR